jgi:hypothetical protein
VPVLIRIRGQKAILREGRWWSAHRDIEKQLNAATDEWFRQTGGPRLDDRDPERTVARRITAMLGGRIALVVPTRQPDARHTYLARRQMELFAPRTE